MKFCEPNPTLIQLNVSAPNTEIRRKVNPLGSSHVDITYFKHFVGRTIFGNPQKTQVSKKCRFWIFPTLNILLPFVPCTSSETFRVPLPSASITWDGVEIHGVSCGQDLLLCWVFMFFHWFYVYLTIQLSVNMARGSPD